MRTRAHVHTHCTALRCAALHCTALHCTVAHARVRRLVIIDTSDGSERAEVAKDARCDVVCHHPALLRKCPCDAIRRFTAGDDAVAPVDVMGGLTCSRTRVVVQENLLVDHDESSVQAVSFNYLRAEWKVRAP